MSSNRSYSQRKNDYDSRNRHPQASSEQRQRHFEPSSSSNLIPSDPRLRQPESLTSNLSANSEQPSHHAESSSRPNAYRPQKERKPKYHSTQPSKSHPLSIRNNVPWLTGALSHTNLPKDGSIQKPSVAEIKAIIPKLMKGFRCQTPYAYHHKLAHASLNRPTEFVRQIPNPSIPYLKKESWPVFNKYIGAPMNRENLKRVCHKAADPDYVVPTIDRPEIPPPSREPGEIVSEKPEDPFSSLNVMDFIAGIEARSKNLAPNSFVATSKVKLQPPPWSTNSDVSANKPKTIPPPNLSRPIPQAKAPWSSSKPKESPGSFKAPEPIQRPKVPNAKAEQLRIETRSQPSCSSSAKPPPRAGPSQPLIKPEPPSRKGKETMVEPCEYDALSRWTTLQGVFQYEDERMKRPFSLPLSDLFSLDDMVCPELFCVESDPMDFLTELAERQQYSDYAMEFSEEFGAFENVLPQKRSESPLERKTVKRLRTESEKKKEKVHLTEGRISGERPVVEKKTMGEKLVSEKKVSNGKSVGDKTTIEKKIVGDRSVAERKTVGDMILVEKKPIAEKSSAEKKTINERHTSEKKSSFERPPVERKSSFDKPPVERKSSLEKLPAERKSSLEKLPVEKKPFVDKPPVERKSSLEKLPAERKSSLEKLPVEKKPFVDKPPVERKSSLEKLPAERKSSLEKLPVEKKPFVDKPPVERKSSLEKLPAERKSSLEKLPVEKKPFVDKPPVERKSSLEKLPVEKKPFVDKPPVERKSSLEKLPAERKSSLEKLPAERKSSLEKLPAEKKSSLERPSIAKKSTLERLPSEKKKIAVEKTMAEKSINDRRSLPERPTAEKAGKEKSLPNGRFPNERKQPPKSATNEKKPSEASIQRTSSDMELEEGETISPTPSPPPQQQESRSVSNPIKRKQTDPVDQERSEKKQATEKTKVVSPNVPSLSATNPKSSTMEQCRMFKVMFKNLAHTYKKRGDAEKDTLKAALDHFQSLCNYIISYYYAEKQNAHVPPSVFSATWKSVFPLADSLLARLKTQGQMLLYGVCLRLTAMMRYHIFDRMHEETQALLAKQLVKTDQSGNQKYLQMSSNLLSEHSKAKHIYRSSEKSFSLAIAHKALPGSFKEVCFDGNVSRGIVIGGEAGTEFLPSFPFGINDNVLHAAIVTKCFLSDIVATNNISYQEIKEFADFM